MTTPEVIEKQNIDISLRGGVNEAERAETLDWTKFLTTAENVVVESSGGLSIRPGYRAISPEPQTTLHRRLLSTDSGALIVGDYGTLYQYAEGAGGNLSDQINKGILPEWAVESTTAAGWPNVTNFARPTGSFITDRYRILVFTWKETLTGYTVVVMDRYSGNTLKRYIGGAGNATSSVTACLSNNRYLYIFESDGVGAAQVCVVDTENLPSSIASAGALTSITHVVAAIPTATGATIFHTGGAIETFNTAGTSTGTGAVAGVTVTDVDYYNSVYYVAGYSAFPRYILKEVNAALATTRTVTDTTAVTVGTVLRVAASSTQARLIAYNTFTTTVAGGTIPYASVYTCSSAATTFSLLVELPAWMEQSLPVYVPTVDRFYVAMNKQIAGVTSAAVVRDTVAGAVVFIDITTQTGDTQNLAEPVFRPAAVVDGYVGSVAYNNNNGDGSYNISFQAKPYRPYQSTSPITVYLCVGNVVSTGTLGFDFVSLKLLSPSHLSCATDFLSGGHGTIYDGLTIHEAGWIDTPSVFVDSAGAGTVDAGLHNYVAVFEYRDSSGKLHLSRTSRVSSITLGGASNVDVQVTVPRVTHKYTASGASIALYRTAGGTTYYRVANKTILTASTSPGYVSFTDLTTNAALALNPILFRQPGTVNTSLDRYHPLSSNHAIRHKDRVFYSKGNNVYYSSFAVDGEAPWFNPAFFITVPGGTGTITGLASMDGVLVVFKRDSIFIVDGEGPPENGGTGTEFSPARKILTEFGCVDQRTIVPTPNGIMYRSLRGIELLSRSLQVNWIGEKVKDTVDENPYSGGACFDTTNGWVLFPVTSALNAALGLFDVSTQNVILCYDVSSNLWTTWKVYAGTPWVIQDVCYTDAAVYDLNLTTLSAASDRVLAIQPAGGGRAFAYFSNTQKTDGVGAENFISAVVETGWIKGPSMQERIKAADLYILAKRLTNHNVKVSVAYDYSDTYTVLKTFTPGTINTLPVEQLNINIPKQSIQAVRFKIETSVPTDLTTYPITTGKQLDLIGLSVRMGIKGGGAKLSSDAKG